MILSDRFRWLLLLWLGVSDFPFFGGTHERGLMMVESTIVRGDGAVLLEEQEELLDHDLETVARDLEDAFLSSEQQDREQTEDDGEEGEDKSASSFFSGLVNDSIESSKGHFEPLTDSVVKTASTMPSAETSKRLWGAGTGTGAPSQAHQHDSSSPGSAGGEASTLPHDTVTSSAPANSAASAGHTHEGTTTSTTTADNNKLHKAQHIPFVAKPSKTLHSTPPPGFTLAARVYIDPRDKLAHFDDSPPCIPYWDCGHQGSTTSPLPLRHGLFRHALTTGGGSGGGTSWMSSSSSATSSTASELGDAATGGGVGTGKRHHHHPVLVVALSPLAIDLNSGESQDFEVGSVILLEDVLLPGHKMRPIPSQHYELSVLFLTLPQQYTQTGKEHCSLPATVLTTTVSDPCPDEHQPGASSSTSRSTTGDVTLDDGRNVVMRTAAWIGARRVRRIILAMLGLSVSTLAADFLGKTAPLWLAVGIGGTCFIVAGTWGVVAAGDSALMALDVWRERRRLGAVTLSADEEEEGADDVQPPVQEVKETQL